MSGLRVGIGTISPGTGDRSEQRDSGMNSSIIRWLEKHSPVVKLGLGDMSSPEKIRHAIKYPGRISDRPMVEEKPERWRKVRLSPERRAQLIAEAERRIEELRRDPEALNEVIEEGRFLDEAFNEPIVEE